MAVYAFGGHTFGVCIRSQATRALLRPYLCAPGTVAQVPLTLSDDDLAEFDAEVANAGMREFYALHKQVAEHLLSFGTLLFHGSCLALDGQGIVFAAPSGVGKSTHARLWRQRFGKRVTMINDDKPLLAIGDDGAVTAYGSPWCGKEHLGTNTSAPLRAIVCLQRGTTDTLRALDRQHALDRLLQQALLPQALPARLQAMTLVGRLLALPIYELTCTPTQSAVDASLPALKA